MMGSPESEAMRYRDEGPQHRVTIPRPFAIGKFEVTFAVWDACVAAGGCNGYRPNDEGWGRGRHPAISVSWDDVKAYAAWLSRKTGKQYRLLSEAEWEYAARAGTATPFHVGATITPEQANYDGNEAYAGGPKGVFRGQTVPVGSFPANAFGVHDMLGNVWEWVEDCGNESYAGAPADGRAWTSGDCTRPVRRGGSWFSASWLVRAAYRVRNPAGVRDVSGGFRVARTLE